MVREIFLSSVLLCIGARAAIAEDTLLCHLTAADKAANDKLSFDDFDQKGVTPSTWRALEKAGCHQMASDAIEDYLVNGPPQSAGQKSDILFHQAQSFAMAGDDKAAARLVAAALPANHTDTEDLDWTAYLIGSWGFFVKDRQTLQAAIAKMAKEPGDANRIDADVLRGLDQCFAKSYSDAYNNCRPKRTPIN